MSWILDTRDLSSFPQGNEFKYSIGKIPRTVICSNNCIPSGLPGNRGFNAAKPKKMQSQAKISILES